MLLLILQSLWTSFFPGHLVDWQVAPGPWALPLIYSVSHSVSTCNKSPSHNTASVLCCVKALQHWLIGSRGWGWGLVLREEIFVSFFVFWSLRQSLKLEDLTVWPSPFTLSAFLFFFFPPDFPQLDQGQVRWRYCLRKNTGSEGREFLLSYKQADDLGGEVTSPLCVSFLSCKKDKMD